MVNIIFDIETTGLLKEDNRITCICLKKGEEVITLMNEDEKLLLEEFFSHLKDCDKLISFNGDDFDVPFIIYRSFFTKAKPSGGFIFPKSLDLRKIAGGFFYNYNKYMKGSLNAYAILLGVECKMSDGEEVAKAWGEKKYDLIKEHCKYDIMLTEMLYNRCRELGLLY